MSNQAEKVGGCLCGAVRYRVHGELRDVTYCHCKQCQRQSGLYFAATASDNHPVRPGARSGARASGILARTRPVRRWP